MSNRTVQSDSDHTTLAPQLQHTLTTQYIPADSDEEEEYEEEEEEEDSWETCEELLGKIDRHGYIIRQLSGRKSRGGFGELCLHKHRLTSFNFYQIKDA